jgi:group I intron endonuclease
MPLMSESGVYMIINVSTEERYVGSTRRRFSNRWSEHKHALRKDSSGCPPLQEAWNLHGEDSFRFVILEATQPDDNIEREQFWMDHYRVLGFTLYNRCPEAASHKGLVMPNGFGDRIRAVHLGRKRSEESRAKMRGHVKSEATIAKLRASLAGHRPTEAIEAGVQDWPAIVDPDGTVHQVRNLLAFVTEHGLDMSAMRKVALGLRSNHEGWTKLLDGQEPKPYQGPLRIVGASHTPVAPDGTRFPNVSNLEAFCRDHGIDPSSLRRTCKGKYAHTQGWTCCPDKAR